MDHEKEVSLVGGGAEVGIKVGIKVEVGVGVGVGVGTVRNRHLGAVSIFQSHRHETTIAGIRCTFHELRIDSSARTLALARALGTLGVVYVLHARLGFEPIVDRLGVQIDLW